MRDSIPFFLSEAALTLYPALADGSTPASMEQWWGGLANNFRSRLDYDEVLLAASGDAHRTAHHVDEEHVLDIGRSWLLPKVGMADFRPARNQQYVMQLLWESEGRWFRRVYRGVTGRGLTMDSQGTNHFLINQTWRAQSHEDASGSGAGEGIDVPVSAAGAQPVPFFRESPLLTGEHLLGHYRWGAAVTLGEVRLIAWPSQGADTELTLEVGGALTESVVTIPAGTANEEVTVTADLGGRVVPANTAVRWRVTSAPEAESAAWRAALTVAVTAGG